VAGSDSSDGASSETGGHAEQLRRELVEALGPLGDARALGTGADKKNYTEKVSHALTEIVGRQLRALGLTGARTPGKGPDRQFMGGYGTKGVDAYLADEKHGLLLSSGTKGILFDVRKNLKNRYRDMVMEALELHKRFPYAVCGHLLFLGASQARRPSRSFGTVLEEAVVLLSGVAARRRPDESPELYEALGLVLLEPGDPGSVELAPAGVPEELHGASYCRRLVTAFRQRNPFYRP